MVRPPIRVYAHRGSTVLAPENTERAFELALGFGADVLETDVRLSRDGVVFVTHDERLERTTDGAGRVRECTAAALARLDAGYRFDDPEGRAARGTGVRLVTLEALLERYPDTPLNVDIKDPDAAAADAVAAVIRRASAEARVTVGSFHAGAMARFRAAAPDVATAATRNEVAALYFGRFRPGFRRAARAPAPLPYRWLQIPPAWLGLPLATRPFIERARTHGVGAVYWTINDVATMRALLDRGASGIVTDRPDLARALREPAAGRPARSS